jgi:hypothetical protein
MTVIMEALQKFLAEYTYSCTAVMIATSFLPPTPPPKSATGTHIQQLLYLPPSQKRTTSSACVQSSTPMELAQSISLVSKDPQFSESNQVGVELDAGVNLSGEKVCVTNLITDE